MFSILMYILLGCALYTASYAQQYALANSYDYTNWFSSFNFQALPDPTNGYVEYISQAEAQSLGLAKVIGNQVFMGVDNTTVLSGSGAGRKSIWITSQNAFLKGLLIGDFAHAPGGVCGTWPGFWTIRNGQGTYGEIDIMEGFNDITQVYTTLHTGGTCSFNPPANTETGTSNNGNTNCNLDNVVGCSVQGPPGSYGAPFNNNGGGVYALQWTSTFIKIFFFPRNAIPQDILAGQPQPSQWGLPAANFDTAYGNCDLAAQFLPQTIYFDTTFCGANAGGRSWTDWTDCSARTGYPTCESYVAQVPQAFSDAYWLINSVKVYSEVGGGGGGGSGGGGGLPISQSAQCGASAGATCLGSTFGNCCSSAGWCGSTTPYCGAGCQPNFGNCN